MLVLLVITSLALVSLDERGSGIINSARTAAQDVVSPLQDLADGSDPAGHHLPAAGLKRAAGEGIRRIDGGLRVQRCVTILALWWTKRDLFGKFTIPKFRRGVADVSF